MRRYRQRIQSIKKSQLLDPHPAKSRYESHFFHMGIPHQTVRRPRENVLHKVRCCLRADYQLADIDFDNFAMNGPLACHESIWILLVLTAVRHLIIEVGGVPYAYLNGNIECPVFIRQPTDSTGK